MDFRVVPVVLGRRWGNDVEVLTGLEAGAQVVVEGSFILKAELGKGSGDEEH